MLVEKESGASHYGLMMMMDPSSRAHREKDRGELHEEGVRRNLREEEGVTGQQDVTPYEKVA